MTGDDETNAVSVKLPTFWPTRPTIWFIQAEAQFALRKIISDDTKYHHLVSSLTADVADRVLHQLQNPPDVDKYKALKDKLLAKYEPSEQERAQELLVTEGLGEKKPSELLDYMRALHNGATDQLFRALFLQQLPQDIQQLLAVFEDDDIDTLAKRADAIVAVQRGSTLSKIKSSEKKVSSKKEGWCWYHTTFAERATKCRPPCTYAGNDQASR